MLRHLHIENYALIQSSDIDFAEGFVVITGETGAGKSIMLGALGLLLGQRADIKALSDTTRKCVVEAEFELHDERCRLFCITNDIDWNDDATIILRRELLPTGKSRAFINDTPVALPAMKEVGTMLIDIHSQHQTLLVGDSGFQTSLLDSLGNGHSILEQYSIHFKEYQELKAQLERLTAEERQNRKDYDYNRFLLDELETSQLKEGEQKELEDESSLLANAEGIKQSLSQISQLMDGDEDSALIRLNACRQTLSKTASLHTSLTQLNERLDSAIIELRDIADSIEEVNEGIVFSPNRQQEVDERLDLIYRLEKKHSVDSVEQLIQINQELTAKLEGFDSVGEEIKKTMEKVDKAYVELQKWGKQLSQERVKAAKKIEKEITPYLDQLGMSNAKLIATVQQTDHYGPTGCDEVAMLFNANKGGEPRELGKVASGGEMSRLMLAIKALTSKAKLLPTVIFDEIDTGVSGDIAVKVGRIMQQMAADMQVVAITHLPQIAARASQHFKVYKSVADTRSTSQIKVLTDKERQYEVAVMLSADPPTQSALQTAAELMELRIE